MTLHLFHLSHCQLSPVSLQLYLSVRTNVLKVIDRVKNVLMNDGMGKDETSIETDEVFT